MVTTNSVYAKNRATKDPCETYFSSELERFDQDPRFHWAAETDLHRRPPNIFSFRIISLTMPYLIALPAGLSDQETSFYSGIFNLLRDRRRVFLLMKQVEADIQALQTRTDFYRAAEALFRVYENRYGFQLASTQTAMPSDDYLKLIEQGKIVLDQGEASRLGLSLGPSIRALPGRWLHGQFTHRLQWHLILRDLLQNPEAYGSPTEQQVYDLYCRIGTLSLSDNPTLDWSQTGLPPQTSRASDDHRLFFQLFDSPENNGSSPGFFHEYRSYWPGAYPR